MSNVIIVAYAFDFIYSFLFYMTQQPLAGQGLLIIEASRPHSDTPHSVRLSPRVINPTRRPLLDIRRRPTPYTSRPL